MMRACNEFATAVEWLVDDELPERDLPAVKDHLARCGACAAYAAELRALNARLGRVRLVTASPDVAPVIGACLRRRLLVKDALLLAGLVALKVLDVWGLFGAGVLPRLALAVLIVGAFALIRATKPSAPAATRRSFPASS